MENTPNPGIDLQKQFNESSRNTLFGFKWPFQKFTVCKDFIKKDKGFFKVVENTCYMYRIQDVTLEQTLLQRVHKLKTMVIKSSDVSDPIYRFKNIKNADEIKDFILRAAEYDRRQKGTLSMQNIGFDA